MIVCCLLASGSAWAAEPIALTHGPALGAGLAAFPRVAGADSAGAQQVNQALASADARGKKAAAECQGLIREAKADPKGAGWQRTVTIAMRGAGYLAVTATDEIYCGGAYPSSSTLALAYDLRTGLPLNWEKLLPKALAGKASLDTGADDTRLGVLESAGLKALYVKAAGLDADCVAALNDVEPTFMLWPDAEEDGVALEPSNLPHVIAACGEPSTIPVATLRPLGVDAGLLDAIEAAHKAKQFGPYRDVGGGGGGKALPGRAKAIGPSVRG